MYFSHTERHYGRRQSWLERVEKTGKENIKSRNNINCIETEMFMWKSLKVMGAADGDGAEGELLAISFHRAEDNTSFNTVKKKKKTRRETRASHEQQFHAEKEQQQPDFNAALSHCIMRDKVTCVLDIKWMYTGAFSKAVSSAAGLHLFRSLTCITGNHLQKSQCVANGK